MPKIVIDEIASGYSLSKINDQFNKIETYINDKVLSRDSDGNANAMSEDLDMNSNQILNLPTPSAPTDPVRLQDIPNLVTAAQGANYVGETAPLTAFQGMRWYNPVLPATFVYYVDGDSGQWVEEAHEGVDGALRSDLQDVNSTVSIAGVPAKQVAAAVNKLTAFVDLTSQMTANATTNTAIINNAINALSAGGVVKVSGAFSLSPVTGTSINAIAVARGDTAPDAPTNSCVLINEKNSIILDLSGAVITAPMSSVISIYRAVNCHIVGCPTFICSSAFGSGQSSPVTMVRSVGCTVTYIASNFYRNSFFLRNAECKIYDSILTNAEYFNYYCSGLLDVTIAGFEQLTSKQFTCELDSCSASGGGYGNYFCEWWINKYSKSYNCGRANNPTFHHSLQTGAIHILGGEIIETANLNTGNIINGVSLFGTGSSPLAGSGSVVDGLRIRGVYYGIGGGGLLTGTIKNNDISDYYMNGITIDALSGYSVSTLIIQDNNIGNIKSTATRLPSGGEVSAGVQLRASGSGTITDIIYDGNTLNPTNKSTITPPSTTYALHSSGVANLRQGSNFVLDSSTDVIV